jgi:hypothetical protein
MQNDECRIKQNPILHHLHCIRSAMQGSLFYVLRFYGSLEFSVKSAAFWGVSVPQTRALLTPQNAGAYHGNS